MHADIKPLSDRALSIATKNAGEARRLAEHLRSEGDWQDVVAGLRSVAVFYDPLSQTAAAVAEALLKAAESMPPYRAAAQIAHIDIPVRYGGEDGPDLLLLCERNGLSPEEFIEKHTAPLYEVALMGFLPGFAYLSGLDPALAAPRLDEPRMRVRAGSVGIGGNEAGIYSLDGSGGWPIIGRTEKKLFDRGSDEPFLLSPGATIHFHRAP
ncbi:5-oxoprolinase subunit PxpB [Parvularcula maris]|uniref:5-oxoprolinase subunit PxpB n=1 Tax=Parvularcula maris TaxID=2965077 RepID=A0A9X2LBB4_9PROT|nr:5-oxoprolinase subunit PxpB [Parvularcula maris]MCQ8186339.1 5-oxoprolinase subunit PxpB [Parvularcula maris]